MTRILFSFLLFLFGLTLLQPVFVFARPLDNPTAGADSLGHSIFASIDSFILTPLSNLFLPLFMPTDGQAVEVHEVKTVKSESPREDSEQAPSYPKPSISPPLIIQSSGLSKQEVQHMIASAISSIQPIQNITNTYPRSGGGSNTQGLADSMGRSINSLQTEGTFSGGSFTGNLNPSLTLGSVLFQGSSGIAEDNTNLYWNNDAKRLRIGSPKPLMSGAPDINAAVDITDGGGVVTGLTIATNGCSVANQVSLDGNPDLSEVRIGDIFYDWYQAFIITSVDDTNNVLGIQNQNSPTSTTCSDIAKIAGGGKRVFIYRPSLMVRGGQVMISQLETNFPAPSFGGTASDVPLYVVGSGDAYVYVNSAANLYSGIKFRGAGYRGEINTLSYDMFINTHDAFQTTSSPNQLYLLDKSRVNLSLVSGGGAVFIGNAQETTGSPAQQLTIRQPKFAKVYYYNGSSYTDRTTLAGDTGSTAYTILSDTDDYFYIGNSARFREMYIEVGTPATGLTLVAEYWNAPTGVWTALTLTDGTSNLTQSGTITYTYSSAWDNTAVNSQTYYWIRLSTTATPSVAPTATVTAPSNRDLLGIYSRPNDSTPLIMLKNTGKFGVGTSTPWGLLSINPNALGSGVPEFVIGSSTATHFIITGGGNLGIGTTSPSTKLSITQSANTSAGGIFLAATDGDSRATFMNTSGVLSFTGGDGTTLNTATLTAAGAWTNASDRSYKENIVDLQYGLDTLKKLQPRFYTMKGSHLPQIGFIAQELEPFVPEVVDGVEGSKGISYGNLVAVVVKAVQELDQKLGTLAEKITSQLGIFNRVETGTIETGTLCVGSTCLTEAELKNLLQTAGVAAPVMILSPQPVASTTTTAAVGESAATSTPADVQPAATTTAATVESANEPIPSPEASPVPDEAVPAPTEDLTPA